MQVESGTMHAYNRTIRNIPCKGGYKNLKSRKSGLLKNIDFQIRVKFCRKFKKNKLTQELWNNRMSFNKDGKRFQYEQNPREQTRAPKTREWRKKCHGFPYGCAAEGKRKGFISSNFIVGISFRKGIVLCGKYCGQMTGTKCADFVDLSFYSASENSIN